MKQFQELFSLNENKLEIYNVQTGRKKTLTLNQFRLLECLIEGKGKKNEIMEHVWEENNIIVSDGSYHQLVFQTRQMLASFGLSSVIIKTLPRHGLKLVRVESEQDGAESIDASRTEGDSITLIPDGNKIDAVIAESLKKNEGDLNVLPLSFPPSLGGKISFYQSFFSKINLWLLPFGAFIGTMFIVYMFLSSFSLPEYSLRKSADSIVSKGVDEDTINQGLLLVDLWAKKLNKEHDGGPVMGRKGFIEDFVGYKYLCLYQSTKTKKNDKCKNYILIY